MLAALAHLAPGLRLLEDQAHPALLALHDVAEDGAARPHPGRELDRVFLDHPEPAIRAVVLRALDAVRLLKLLLALLPLLLRHVLQAVRPVEGVDKTDDRALVRAVLAHERHGVLHVADEGGDVVVGADVCGAHAIEGLEVRADVRLCETGGNVEGRFVRVVRLAGRCVVGDEGESDIGEVDGYTDGDEVGDVAAFEVFETANA